MICSVFASNHVLILSNSVPRELPTAPQIFVFPYILCRVLRCVANSVLLDRKIHGNFGEISLISPATTFQIKLCNFEKPKISCTRPLFVQPFVPGAKTFRLFEVELAILFVRKINLLELTLRTNVDKS